MRANLRFLVVIVLLAAGVLAGLIWHQRTTAALRAELEQQRATHARQQASQQAEQQEQQLVAARARAEELDRLLADRAAVARLQAELASLRQRAGEIVPAGEARVLTSARPSLVGNVLVFSLWKNAGRATPEAAFETGLWASVNGDIDTLTSLLVFDTESRNEAAALYARLPETLRQEFVSPERLIAVLAAKDVPLGSATILNQFPAANETKVSAQIFDAEGKHRFALLSLRPDEAGWKFVVSTNAVKRYAAWLRPPVAGQTP